MTPGDRKWFQSRLAPFAAGLLSQEEEARFHALASTDPVCAKLLEQFDVEARQDPEDAVHLSPEIMARWNRAEAELKGVERDMVVQHLTSCPSCREDLDLLGHSYEWALASTKQERLSSQPDSGLGARIRSWIFSPAGGFLGAAAAAAVVFFVFLPGDTDWLYMAESPPTGAKVVALDEASRSTEVSRFDLASSEVLAVPLQGLVTPATGALERIEVTLVFPDGTTQGIEPALTGDLSSSLLVLGTEDKRFHSGVYRLELLVITPSSARTLEFPFELSIEGRE